MLARERERELSCFGAIENGAGLMAKQSVTDTRFRVLDKACARI